MLLEPFQTADGGVHWDRVPAGKYIGDLACALPKDEAAHCQTRTRWLDDRDRHLRLPRSKQA
jgi:hypothetical protein